MPSDLFRGSKDGRVLPAMVRQAHHGVGRYLATPAPSVLSLSKDGRAFPVMVRDGSDAQRLCYGTHRLQWCTSLAHRGIGKRIGRRRPGTAVAWQEDGRGCLFGNRGAVAGSRRPARVSSRPRFAEVSGPHGPGVAFRHPRSASFCLLARTARRSHASGERILPGCFPAAPPRGSGNDQIGRAALVRTNSRTVGRQHLAFGPGAGRRHARCRIQTSRQERRRPIIATPSRRGDSRTRGYRRRAGIRREASNHRLASAASVAVANCVFRSTADIG